MMDDFEDKSKKELINEINKLESNILEHKDKNNELSKKIRKLEEEIKNYKQREHKRIKQEKQNAVKDVLQNISKIRDLLVTIYKSENIKQKHIQSIITKMDTQFEKSNIKLINPTVGSTVNPNKHNVIYVENAREEKNKNTIKEVYSVGYKFNDDILKPADVVVYN